MSTARALKSREFREVIKAEIAKRFDGDYDALFKNIYHKKLSDGVSFVEHIAMAYASLHRHLGEKVGAAAALQAIADAAGRVPKFQIAVPVHFEHWDARSYVPLVTYVPAGVDEKDLVKLKAYDFDGRVYWLDAKKAPDAPVVVLGINERTDESGNVKAYTLPPDDGGGGGGGGGGTTYVFRATSLTVGRDYEGWFDGDMEIYFKVWYAGDWHEVGYVTGVQQDQSYSIDVILRQFSDPSAGT
ncbi:MAG: DUF3103 family protein [Bacteroidota bacterium]